MSLKTLKARILAQMSNEDRKITEEILTWRFVGNHYDQEEAEEYREYLVDPKFEGEGFWKWEQEKCIPLTPEDFGLTEEKNYIDITYEE